jgi:DNA-binding transcriptional regulator LsrR (DeoR family)
MNLLGKDSVIGLSWGKTLCEFVKNLPYGNYPDCRVVQLVGIHSRQLPFHYAFRHIKMASEKLNCVPVFLYAPFLIGSIAAKRQLLEILQINTCWACGKANINIIGTGI